MSQNLTCSLSEDDKDFARTMVREAGRMSLKFRATGFEKWEKTPGDPVTEADLAIDTFLRESFTERFPHEGWISEETEDDNSRLTHPSFWVADPIDGTLAYVQNRDDFSVTVAYMVGGMPVYGLVYAPARNEFFEAEIGKGATLNGTPIAVSGRSTFEGSDILSDGTRERSTKIIGGEPWPELRFREIISMAMRVATIASGEYDASIAMSPKSDWDIAAAILILHEAGGKSGNAYGEPLSFARETTRQPSIMCSTPELWDELIGRTTEIFKNRP